MTIKRQHYVPQVYLKAWETQVVSKKEPNKLFNGIYYFEKNNLKIGDGRNKNSILSKSRLYNIDYGLSYIIKSCPIIEKDYIDQIVKKLEERKMNAFHIGKQLKSRKDISDNFAELENWEFKYKFSPFEIASKKAIINEIKQINSYVIEHALDNIVEKKWNTCLNNFINAMEETIPLNGVDEIRRISGQKVIEIVQMIFFLICRNPDFDYMGILPKILDIFSEPLSEIVGSEKAKDILENQKTAIWLNEIYNGLFGVQKGYFHEMKQTAKKNFQMMLYKCWENQGTFITSDIPAFIHLSSIESSNLNSIICPLTPEYILLITKGSSNRLRDVNFRMADNRLVRHLNKIVLNHSKKVIISNQKYLGYII